jgi:2-keto-3-deoxy-L-rhamnonate aldolase RhmA
LRSNERYIGTMLSEISFPNMPVLFKSGGLDFFLIDTEHGGFDQLALSGLIMSARLAGVTVLIRLADAGRRDITRLMDMGAHGLLLPMTNSPSDIAAVVEHAKYAPIGRRGISTMRGHTSYNPSDLQEYMRQANEQTMIFAQIETKAGLACVEDILQVEGVTGAILGPNDLACDLNCIGEVSPILEAVSRIAQAAKQHKKVSGVITSDHTILSLAKSEGMEIVCYGSELHMLKTSCMQIRQKITAL